MDPQTIFFLAGVIFIIILAALLFPALVRLNRILFRIDEVSGELLMPARQFAKALAVLKGSAVSAAIAYFLNKAAELHPAKRAARKRSKNSEETNKSG